MAGTATAQAAQPGTELYGDDGGAPAPPMDQRGEVAKSGMDRFLGKLPNVLSSKPVIIFGIILFCYLFLYAGIASLLGHAGAVSANTQLILGNYTNVSSSVGAGIAAGAGLTLLKRQNRTHKLTVAAHDAALEAKALAEETHRILHRAFPEHAAAEHSGYAAGGAGTGGSAAGGAAAGAGLVEGPAAGGTASGPAGSSPASTTPATGGPAGSGPATGGAAGSGPAGSGSAADEAPAGGAPSQEPRLPQEPQ